MDFVKKNKKKFILVGLVLIFAVILFIIKFSNNDLINIYYRTYTKEKGWSSWTKNGQTSGNLKDDILNIQVRVDKKENGEAKYRIYSIKNNWSDEYGFNAEIENQEITGVRFGFSEVLGKKSQICYRTYNEENEWMEWSCSGIINGNKNNNIKGIEIKAFNNNSSLEDYLKDYSKKEISSIGFEGADN